jgi:hypothetical protein
MFSIPGENASDAWHVGTVYTCRSHPVEGHEQWATDVVHY